ncbi:unnamed protein product [Allacma fusca]|uniref:Glutathione S-transferase n=1 Tax=Allacma fusca TaxID=39272 RepID=A0A8J2PMJ6_9HEXA|nr:unnamed protein product [Allacma fusca]
MVLKTYVDPVSQPSRALMLFVRAAKIDFEENLILIREGQQKTDEYAKINKFQKVPAIVHDDFQLAESISILRYLARTFTVDDHWYPKDVRSQARVDEFLAWQHLGLRLPLTRYILAVIRPELLFMLTTKPTEEDLANLKKQAEKALDDVEKLWLEGSKFVHGDEISIADLMAVGEIEMIRLTGYNPREGRPKLSAFLDRVKETVGADLYDGVHEDLNKVVDYFAVKLAK